MPRYLTETAAILTDQPLFFACLLRVITEPPRWHGAGIIEPGVLQGIPLFSLPLQLVAATCSATLDDDMVPAGPLHK